MTRTLFSLYALLTFFALTNAQASVVSLERDTAISYQATVGKAFAVDLAAKVKTVGDYSIVNTSSWLKLSAQGILFGTPAEAELGLHKVFVSVMNKGAEFLFRVNINVVSDPTSPNFNYAFKVGQIVKIDVAALCGVKGKFVFTGLPTWLEGTEAGVLVGMPEKTDVGKYQIEFSVVDGAEKVFKSVMHVEVEANTPPPSTNAFMAQVGVPTAINIKALAKLDGTYTIVHAPVWMTYTADGWLQGTPLAEDIGESYVSFVVANSHTKQGYTFRTLVTE